LLQCVAKSLDIWSFDSVRQNNYIYIPVFLLSLLN